MVIATVRSRLQTVDSVSAMVNAVVESVRRPQKKVTGGGIERVNERVGAGETSGVNFSRLRFSKFDTAFVVYITLFALFCPIFLPRWVGLSANRLRRCVRIV